VYDIDAATGLLRAAPRSPQPLPVMDWARAYGLVPDPGSGPRSVSLIGPGPGFDPGYAMTTSLDDPVIIASVTVAGEPPAPLLITTDATACTRPPSPAARSCRHSS